MEFGIALISRIRTDPALVSLAEELGYAEAWFCDSQMVYSDVYATMALAARETSRIRLGTGVAVVSTRMAPTIAHSIATINEIAPGRVELGIGVGNTARLSMGLRPVKFRKMVEDVRVIRALLAGETVLLHEEGEEHCIRFLHPDQGFINLEDHIPVTLSAFGPKGIAFCGTELDGHMVFGLALEPVIEQCRDLIGQAARQAGRDPATVPTKGIFPTAVLGAGETTASPRIMRSLEPFAANVCHMLVEWGARAEALLPGTEELAVRFRAYTESLPEDSRHLVLHEGHLFYAREDQRQFITPELAEMAAVVGEPDALIERIRRLEAAGLSHYAIQVDYSDPERQLRDFATLVVEPYCRG